MKNSRDSARSSRMAAATRPCPNPPGSAIPSDRIVVPMKIVQNPGLTLILYEEFARFRQIFTDGRGPPPVSQPAWLGYSIRSDCCAHEDRAESRSDPHSV